MTTIHHPAWCHPASCSLFAAPTRRPVRHASQPFALPAVLLPGSARYLEDAMGDEPTEPQLELTLRHGRPRTVPLHAALDALNRLCTRLDRAVADHRARTSGDGAPLIETDEDLQLAVSRWLADPDTAPDDIDRYLELARARNYRLSPPA